MMKRILSTLLALCMALALLPVQSLALSSPYKEDKSMEFSRYVNEFGIVYDLETGEKTVLDCDVPANGGITMVLFAGLEDGVTIRALEELENESWARRDGLSIIFVESKMNSREDTRAAVGHYLESGLFDKVYYREDSNAYACWYEKLRFYGSDRMEQFQTLEQLQKPTGTFKSSPLLPMLFLFTEVDGVKSCFCPAAGSGACSLQNMENALRSWTNVPVDGEDTAYTVTFDPNGGTVSLSSAATKADGRLMADPPTPQRSGYAFYDWYTAPTGGERVTMDTVFTKDTTIYAQWNKISGNGTVYKDSGDLSVPKMSKQEVIQLVNGSPYQMPTDQPFDTEPSISAPYAIGKVNDAVLETATARLNSFRKLAGVPAVTLDQGACSIAQHGAVIMAAKSEMDHYPKQPGDMSASFYETAYRGTSGSNLASGAIDPVGAVDLFMSDSDRGNIASVGHRMAQLDPTLASVGFGYAIRRYEGYSVTGNYVTEYIRDTSGPGCDYEFIGWPSSGYFPDEWFDPVIPWSVWLNSRRYADPDPNTVTVTLKSEGDGKEWTFSQRTASLSGNYLNVRKSSGLIVFRPADLETLDGVYTVTINGLKDTKGSDTSLSYRVEFFAMPQVHTVTFDGNGGTPEFPSAVTTESGQLAKLPTAKREGYTLKGWFSRPTGGTQITEETAFKRPSTVYAVWTKASGSSTISFTDVPDWAKDAVDWAVEKGVTNGTSATTFSPNATCTMAHILTFLWRAKDEPKPEGTVTGTQYYDAAAQWAKEQGLIDSFTAGADCTRAMVVTYLWKLAGSPDAGTSAFTDGTFPHKLQTAEIGGHYGGRSCQ